MARRKGRLCDAAIKTLLEEGSDSDDDLGEYDWDSPEEAEDEVVMEEVYFDDGVETARTITK